MDARKYEILGEQVRELDGGVRVHRIRRLSDGALGGFVQSEENLSQQGTCWIHDDAVASGAARVVEDAQLRGRAAVSGQARISGKAVVQDDATVGGKARVQGEARVERHAAVSGEAEVSGSAELSDHAVAADHARISGKCHLWGLMRVTGDSKLEGAYPVSGAQFGLRHNLTVTGGHVLFGDKRYTHAQWQKLPPQDLARIGIRADMRLALLELTEALRKLSTLHETVGR